MMFGVLIVFLLFRFNTITSQLSLTATNIHYYWDPSLVFDIDSNLPLQIQSTIRLYALSKPPYDSHQRTSQQRFGLGIDQTLYVWDADPLCIGAATPFAIGNTLKLYSCTSSNVLHVRKLLNGLIQVDGTNFCLTRKRVLLRTGGWVMALGACVVPTANSSFQYFFHGDTLTLPIGEQDDMNEWLACWECNGSGQAGDSLILATNSSCIQNSTQIFSFNEDQTMRLGSDQSLCVTINTPIQDGSNVHLMTCTNPLSTESLWYRHFDNTIRPVSDTTLCLNGLDNTDAYIPGTLVKLNTCTSHAQQVLQLTTDPIIYTQATFRPMDKQSLCWTPDSLSNNSIVRLQLCNNTRYDQIWEFHQIDDSIRIYNFCLGVTNHSLPYGDTVVIITCDTNDNRQQWFFPYTFTLSLIHSAIRTIGVRDDNLNIGGILEIRDGIYPQYDQHWIYYPGHAPWLPGSMLASAQINAPGKNDMAVAAGPTDNAMTRVDPTEP